MAFAVDWALKTNYLSIYILIIVQFVLTFDDDDKGDNDDHNTKLK